MENLEKLLFESVRSCRDSRSELVRTMTSEAVNPFRRLANKKIIEEVCGIKSYPCEFEGVKIYVPVYQGFSKRKRKGGEVFTNIMCYSKEDRFWVGMYISDQACSAVRGKISTNNRFLITEHEFISLKELVGLKEGH